MVVVLTIITESTRTTRSSSFSSNKQTPAKHYATTIQPYLSDALPEKEASPPILLKQAGHRRPLCFLASLYTTNSYRR
jgi:hypothetical protein